jgi:hypothetical protein
MLSSYLHCYDQHPKTLSILDSLKSLSTNLFEDYQLSLEDFERHQQQVHIILFPRPTNDLVGWHNRLTWLEGRIASGYRHVEYIIRECRKEYDAIAVSCLFKAVQYIQTIQDEDDLTPLQRRLQHHYR